MKGGREEGWEGRKGGSRREMEELKHICGWNEINSGKKTRQVHERREGREREVKIRQEGKKMRNDAAEEQ